MPSRLSVLLLFASWISSGHLGYAQQIIEDVSVSWVGNPGLAALNPPHYPCDQKGRIFYEPNHWPDMDHRQTVARVNEDGSTSLFQIPDEKESVMVFAPSNSGAAVIAAKPSDGSTYHVYLFDDKGKVVRDHTVSLDFRPDLMAVTSSDEIVLVGVEPPYHTYKKPTDLKFGGAVLDVNDKVVQLFRFPPTAEGGNYAPEGPMVGGDGVAYLYLNEEVPANLGGYRSSVATIAESGHVGIGRSLSPSKDPKYLARLFGPGVDVEEYFFPLKTGNLMRLEEYDLTTGNRLGTKIAPWPTFRITTTCYRGDLIVWLANEGEGDSQSTHRVTVNLEPARLHP